MGKVAARLDGQGRSSLARWAADCAEHVLPVFERACPGDDRPRRAVRAARAWAAGEIRTGEAAAAALAAHAAARRAEGPAARAAARAAGHAAATAHATRHASHAATYAATAASLAGVADPAASAAERRWQHARVPRGLERVAFPA
ncbi:hypothetical protein P0Y31_14710 [Knoellia sp. 3-2P3]|uniref:putative immunity protein n=1 Tax=unclassified Knoellia TaxID=2618719 RepID=UPI0023D98D31|nr:hypothetical protein [Knoellia sp. 3-2P3]MDF2093602.1 hypothetical protein [Knoellia sp. 3-2P3]